MRKLIKTLLGPVILTATVAVFAYYLVKHPQTVDHIKQMPLGTLVLIVALYLVWFGALVLITRGSLRIYHKLMSWQENLLFNAYSSLINFFGPGQSGPIFRGAYLKKRHNLGVKQYLFATLLYYAFYAIISALLMVVGSRPWWQTALLMTAVAVVSMIFIRWYKKRSKINTEGGLTLINIGWILGATILQIVAQTIIYAIELHNVGSDASIGQILSYTGVANFALFVALTPGAIGIREAFLAFGQQLHHVDVSTIVAANVIDRAAYLVFLGTLFVMTAGLHAKDKLRLKSLKLDKPST
jgi:uncharacterized membrane protein YbhN (UPF0104 family)